MILIWTRLLNILMLSTILLSCDMVRRANERAKEVNSFEVAALNLSKKNRALKVKMSKVQFEVQELKSKNKFLNIEITKLKKELRKKEKQLQSGHFGSVASKKDYVRFEIFKWAPSQLLKVAEEEFRKKNFEKSAQFFDSFIKNYSNHERVDDQLYFYAGVSSYESGKDHERSKRHFSRLIRKYPTSRYFRGAKLWKALTELKQGMRKEFFQVVEEFRKKYRNTPEWKILSAHYEKIRRKYKN
ncbi:MAG: tetratricopeptide repeat protein [Bdellovibrionota bacterium]|nr:tetratricopeptide repeat protein [Bdellovibrionota bacterium]